MITISQQIRGNLVKIFSHKYAAIFKLNSSPFPIFLMKSCELGFESVESTISVGERPQAAHLLRSWVRIPPGAWIFVCCECRVLSGRGLCDELITRP